MSELPSLDEAFPLPTVDEAFPRVKPQTLDGQIFDEYFAKHRVMDLFGAGLKHGWGARPFGDYEKPEQSWVKQMREAGVFNDYDKHQNNWVKTFNESLLRSAAMGIDALFRAPMALYYGVGNVAVGEGVPRDVVALPEAFSAGRFTALPTRVQPTMRALERARELEVIGRQNDVLARQEFAPEGIERPTERVVEAVIERPVEVVPAATPDTAAVISPEPTLPQPADIHSSARLIAPDTFRQYDALAEQKQVFTRWLDELEETRRNDPRTVKAQQEIDTILGKVRGVEERLTKRAATRLEEIRSDLETYLTTDTPDMMRVRKARQEVDFQMRDLAPEVSEAYREAQRLQPRIDPVLEAVREPIETLTERRTAEIGHLPPPAPGMVRFYHGGVVEPKAGEMRWVSQHYEYARDYREGAKTYYVDIPENSPLLKKTFEDEGTSVKAPYANFEAPPEIAAQLKPVTPPANIVELAQRRPTIARDIERQLLEVGRTAEEARASAALVQAHYEARAARFNGALGTARDLYAAEAPAIVAGEGRARGGLNLARNEIRLFKEADASTFMHETAHSWLEEIRRDAQHELAPPDLRADLATVKSWLGAEGDTFTRAQHEKFARGFERYLMEGQAPSSRLAQVFEKFKNWLTQIYQSVARLRAPITDDIRGVYDRLLAAPSKEPVIVPERPGAMDFATHAEEVARATDASKAAEVAGQVLIDRERVAEQLSKAVDDARRAARRGPERVNIPRPEGAGGESAPARESPPPPDAAINTGRNPPTGKSAAPRTAGDAFDPVDGPLVDKAGNIRLDNLNLPEDVAGAIRLAAEEGGGFVEARRGILSDVETLKLADDLGMSPNKLDRRRIGEAFNAEEIIQARRLLVQSATDVRDAMGKAAVGDEAGIIQYAIARERHLMIQEQVAGITAEAGRALRAFRQMEGMKDAALLTDFFQRRVGKTPEALQREAQMGLRLDNARQTGKFLAQQAKPSWQHMVVEGWMSSLLSGPMTHLRNVIGNTSVAVYSVPETALAAGISRVLRHERGVEFAEVGDRLFGLGQGSVDGVRSFGKAIVDETYALEREAHTDERMFRRAIPSVNVGGIEVPVGQAIRFPLRLLAAEDEFFKALGFRQELNVLARRSARLEGLEGSALDARIAELLLDPTDEMLVGATKHAQYQTFTNQLGPKGRAMQQWADTHPFARFIFPFIRTPINIFKFAGERTPFGIMSATVRDNIMGRNGEIAQATQLARLALGTMVMTGVGVLAANGLITGGGSNRGEVRNNNQQAGIQPYSIKLGNTMWSYQGIDPVSFPIAIATDLYEVAQSGMKEDADFDKVAAMAVVNLAQHGVVERLPLRTLANMFAAVIDYEQHGSRFINSMVQTFVPVPAAVGQMAQIADPIQRDTRALTDALMARAGMRGGLRPRRDVWGEPIPQTDVGPIRVSELSQDPVRREVARLGVSLAMPQRKIEGVEMTPEQYDDYVRISGRFAKTMLDDAIEQPWFQNMTDGLKKITVHNFFENARSVAKAQIMMESVGTDNDLVAKGVEEKMKLLK